MRMSEHTCLCGDERVQLCDVDRREVGWRVGIMVSRREWKPGKDLFRIELCSRPDVR